jgi:nucleoside-diphosphate-sugar epimerase
MNPAILVAGGTGDLGARIIKALINRGADVHALVRHTSKPAIISELEQLGVKLVYADLFNKEELTPACKGMSCIVSALAGLHDVIVDAQSILLDAAVAAGVPRFIPSDFSTDFTKMPVGENRNLDLRKEFHKRLDQAPISATSIFNGAFDYILKYNTPLFNLKNQTVSYWGESPDRQVDFSTLDNVADFTAAAALDASAPRYLRIASFQVSPNELVSIARDIRKTVFKLVPFGSLENLSANNKRDRAANPQGETELYPRWQSSQYMHSMFSVQNEPLNNDRYSDVKWVSAVDVIAGI